MFDTKRRQGAHDVRHLQIHSKKPLIYKDIVTWAARSTLVGTAEGPVAAPHGDVRRDNQGDRQTRPSSRKRVNAAQWLNW